MVRIFYKEGRLIKRENDIRELGKVQGLVWVDLQSPTAEEEEWVENKCAISFQTPQEIVEIESSSRFFESLVYRSARTARGNESRGSSSLQMRWYEEQNAGAVSGYSCMATSPTPSISCKKAG